MPLSVVLITANNIICVVIYCKQTANKILLTLAYSFMNTYKTYFSLYDTANISIQQLV